MYLVNLINLNILKIRQEFCFLAARNHSMSFQQPVVADENDKWLWAFSFYKQLYGHIHVPLASSSSGCRTSPSGALSQVSNKFYFYLKLIIKHGNFPINFKPENLLFWWRSRLDTRSGRGRTMCAMYWQLNDVWAAPSWSSLDVALRWKPLHYYARRFFAPVILSLVGLIIYYFTRTNWSYHQFEFVLFQKFFRINFIFFVILRWLYIWWKVIVKCQKIRGENKEFLNFLLYAWNDPSLTHELLLYKS